MTGFARAEGEADGVSWAWELKSVNSRSLDLRLRLPPGFDPLEAQLRASLARRLRRGNVGATLAISRLRSATLFADLSGFAPTMPEERVAQELTIVVTRADVREELDRLRGHIAQAGDLLERGEAIGRQVDFLCQERSREGKTLCSKS